MERTCGGDLLWDLHGDMHGDLSGDLSRNKCENLHRNLYWRSKEITGGHKRPHSKFQEVQGTLGHLG